MLVPITTLSSDIPAANTLAQDHIQILQEATTAIQKAQERYTRQTNKKRQHMDFKVNDYAITHWEKTS